jgi:solute carrier family 8 (sodium/calcium exchanger)
LIPGTSLLHPVLLGIFYFIGLMYLFVGISIVSDIFMEAIECITSQTKQVELWEKEGNRKFYIEVPVWNATVANLTLMALGSSAPEILLSVIETVKDLSAVPGELGPSTIVGSAAFNLLMISAFSIVAVDETPKKIADLGTFWLTSVASIWAYIWLYICLQGSGSPEIVTPAEGWVTLAFFFILVILSFISDKINAHLEQNKKTIEEMEEQNREQQLKIQKNDLRQHAKDWGQSIVIEIAKGVSNKQTSKVPDSLQREIRSLYREILGVDSLAEVEVSEFWKALQPDTLLERFAYRK